MLAATFLSRYCQSDYQKKLDAKRAAGAAASGGSGGGATDISREDMMHLTMKMSKRIKTMEAHQTKLKAAHARAQAFAEQVLRWALCRTPCRSMCAKP